MNQLTHWIGLFCLIALLSGCSVPNSSFAQPSVAHDNNAARSLFGKWVAHSDNGDMELVFSDYAATPVIQRLKEAAQTPEQREEIQSNLSKQGFSFALAVKKFPAPNETPNPLQNSNTPPLAGFAFRAGNELFLCVGWDILNYMVGVYNLEITGNLVKPLYYVVRVRRENSEKMQLDYVTYTTGDDRDGKELKKTTSPVIRLYENTSLNTGSELAEVISRGEYATKVLGMFERVKESQKKQGVTP